MSRFTRPLKARLKRLIEPLYRKATQVRVITVLGAAAILTATMGFSDWGPDSHFSLEPFFKAAGFLVLDGLGLSSADLAEEDLKGCLTFARILSILTVGSATFALVWHYVGNDLILYRRRDHCVLVGAGWKGHKILEDLVRHQDAVVVDPVIDEGFARWCRLHAVGVVHGDATEQKNLELAGVHRAAKVYIFCGDDETNLQVANLLGEEYPATAARKDRLDCFVELASQRNFAALNLAIHQPLPPSASAQPTSPNHAKEPTLIRRSVKARLVNVENATARALLERHPLDRFTAFKDAPVAIAHILVLGDTPMAREIIRQAMQQAHYETGRHLHITVFTTNPAAVSRGFADRYPAFAPHTRIGPGVYEVSPREAWVRAEHILPTVTFRRLPTFEDGLIAATAGQADCQSLIECAIRHLAEPQAVTVFVALGKTPQTINCTLCLAGALARLGEEPHLDLAICAHVTARNTSFLSALHLNLQRAAPNIPIHPFEDFLGDYSSASVEAARLDDHASRIWNHYRGNNTPLDPDAQELWLQESEYNKDSNRQAADHANVKHRISTRITAADPIPVIGEIEHRRWCAEKLLQGFRSLTRFPATTAEIGRFISDPEDIQLIKDWFGWGNPNRTPKKRAWIARKRHLDLVPFFAIRPIILATQADEAAEQVQKEEGKDHEQVEFVLRHLPPPAAPPP